MNFKRSAYIADLLKTISARWFGRGRGGGPEPIDAMDLPALAQSLLSTRGEASGVLLAEALVARWETLADADRRAWFQTLATDFGAPTAALEAAVAAWREDPSPANAARLHGAAESRRQELFRRINLARGGTRALVAMRHFLLEHLAREADLREVDYDFAHLLGSWFNRGFLRLERIDWSSPAAVLEKIIRYEAVHQIANWDDLRNRLAPPDRRCFAFFHPQMPDEPLIFVEVALTRGMPAEIAPLLDTGRAIAAADEVDTAVFYSISNTQVGLRGVSFGNFLIKQVVDELLRELPALRHFVTLSPLPGFARWLARRAEEESALAALLAQPDWAADPARREQIAASLPGAASRYLLQAKGEDGRPLDPVARFHLNNGARLERINFCGDVSAKGLATAHGLMVNYLYERKSIERNHEHYANANQVAASPAVRRLLAQDRAAARA
ncbi:MAG: malonyl-CoA decarboxylase [Gammaproteobacteria bacterium]